jgi:hypothetical protein
VGPRLTNTISLHVRHLPAELGTLYALGLQEGDAVREVPRWGLATWQEHCPLCVYEVIAETEQLYFRSKIRPLTEA